MKRPNILMCYSMLSGLKLMSEKDLLEVKDVSKDVSGKYVCMATNCIDRSIRSNVSIKLGLICVKYLV